MKPGVDVMQASALLVWAQVVIASAIGVRVKGRTLTERNGSAAKKPGELTYHGKLLAGRTGAEASTRPPLSGVGNWF